MLLTEFVCRIVAKCTTFVDVADKETTEVEVEDSELADSLSGDPGRLIFFRFRGLPFNLGARWLHKYGCSSNSA